MSRQTRLWSCSLQTVTPPSSHPPLVSIRHLCSDLRNGLGYLTRAYLSADDALLFLFSAIPDGSFESVLPPTIEFDSAAAALRIFHTKVFERKSLVIPAQCEQPLFPLDSTAACQPACPALRVPPLPSAPTAPSGTSRPFGPVRPQYTVARQESGKNTQVYPTCAELYFWNIATSFALLQSRGGAPVRDFFKIKFNWLDYEDLGVLSIIHPDFKAMTISVPRLLQVDFTSLKDPVLDYASHTLIAPTPM